MTVPQLFIKGLKVKNNNGNNKCFYCGASCDEKYTIKEYVRKTFTGHNTVMAHGSQFICHGCVYCLKEKALDLELIDGEKREKQRTRSYSWILNGKKTIAATKAHISLIRNYCLNVKDKMFAIILAESGQKHLLYRSFVNMNTNYIKLSLEEEVIEYEKSELKNRIDFCKKIIRFTGKPSLKEKITINMAEKIITNYKDGENILEKLELVQKEQLTKLAVWLSPNKKECENEYNEPERVPKQISLFAI